MHSLQTLEGGRRGELSSLQASCIMICLRKEVEWKSVQVVEMNLNWIRVFDKQLGDVQLSLTKWLLLLFYQ